MRAQYCSSFQPSWNCQTTQTKNAQTSIKHKQQQLLGLFENNKQSKAEKKNCFQTCQHTFVSINPSFAILINKYPCWYVPSSQENDGTVISLIECENKVTKSILQKLPSTVFQHDFTQVMSFKFCVKNKTTHFFFPFSPSPDKTMLGFSFFSIKSVKSRSNTFW